MNTGMLEHVNVTVSNPRKTAELLCTLFEWDVRWFGKAKNGGYTYHVGNKVAYLAVYTLDTPAPTKQPNSNFLNGLNHIGIVVDDLEIAERRVVTSGLKPYAHGSYEPGSRFYFRDFDGIEYEVVSYAEGSQENA